MQEGESVLQVRLRNQSHSRQPHGPWPWPTTSTHRKMKNEWSHTVTKKRYYILFIELKTVNKVHGWVNAFHTSECLIINILNKNSDVWNTLTYPWTPVFSVFIQKNVYHRYPVTVCGHSSFIFLSGLNGPFEVIPQQSLWGQGLVSDCATPKGAFFFFSEVSLWCIYFDTWGYCPVISSVIWQITAGEKNWLILIGSHTFSTTVNVGHQ